MGPAGVRVSCAFTDRADKRINDNMGRIRLNETNLLLFFNNRLIFLNIQSLCQKNITALVNQVFIRGKLPSLTKNSDKLLNQNRGQLIEFKVSLSCLFEKPV